MSHDDLSTPSHLRRMTDYLSGLELDALPSGAMELLKLCMLDTLGCLIGGLGTETAAVMHRLAGHTSGSGTATVVGFTQGQPADTAALINGTVAHALIFDDMHRHSKLHPGVVTLPAVLAVAEAVDADGDALLCGLAAGYECAARVGVALDLASHRQRGWRATGTAGSLGAAAGVARTMRLSAASFHHALAAATAQASGTFAFQESGGMELYFAAGTAARNGVVAGYLARAGFQGAAEPLEAADGGYLHAASDAPAAHVLSDALGARFRMQDVCVKMHPTCHSTQTAIDAALILRDRHGIRAGDVEQIVVEAGDITRLQCGWDFVPAQPERMIFHMGMALAIALESGGIVPSDYHGQRTSDPALVRVASATRVHAMPELTAIYKEKKPAIVHITLRNGQTVSERVDFCQGEPENPPRYDTVHSKFHALCAPHMKEPHIRELAQRVMDIERLPSCRPITQQLRLALPGGI
jgi:2-methylcitrate dehydratase PrpD